jgi:hypothetical protein
MPPTEFSTLTGTIAGPIDGRNTAFSFTPYPYTVQYSVSSASGNMLFRNGLLVDPLIDYVEGPGYFTLGYLPAPDTVTARVYQGGGPTRLRLGAGISQNGSRSLWLSPQSPTFTTGAPFMLFRNGQLLTSTVDYTLSGPWISLVAIQAIQPGDSVTALIGTGAIPVTVTGTISGLNNTFTVPAFAQLMLFRNGQLLTQGLDYTVFGTSIIISTIQIPQVGDTLAAYIWLSGGPVQVTTYDGSLSYAQPVESLIFEGGFLQTQPADSSVTGDTVYVLTAPQAGSNVTVETWIPDITDPSPVPFNLPVQVSTADGSIAGSLNGVNNVFTLVTSGLVTQILLWWNRNFLQQGAQFSWSSLQLDSTGAWTTTITLIGGLAPASGDMLTGEIFTA